MKIIVGLGNPGRKYAGTRHNIGFDAVAEIARQLGTISVKTRFEAEVIEVGHGGEKVLLLCPQTYMNVSGRSVRAALDFYKLTPDDVLVISDDLNLPIGTLRLRSGGSAGGQKGLADTIRHLGTDQIARLRIGIDRPPAGYDVSDFVLGKFTDDEINILAPVVGNAADAALLWVKSGIADAMNRYNATPEAKSGRKNKSNKSTPPPL